MARRGSFHVVLLAGGSGTRFWPWSRARRPKQFLPLAGREPLLVTTWRRMLRIARKDRIWVVAPADRARDVRAALPALGRDRLIVEPSPRDTAAAVVLACAAVSGADPRAIVGVFPTDHVVRNGPAFARSVRIAIGAAGGDALVCLGVRPDRPATGYGYLRCARTPSSSAAVAVERFVEKPEEPTARRFLRSGRYLWNAGMFVWRASRFLEEAERTAPEIVRHVRAHLGGRRGAWEAIGRTSVDYAVMEKSSSVEAVLLDAGWDDVGSWDAAARIRSESGTEDGAEILVDSPGSVVFGRGRMVAVVDVPGAVVVDAPDALLVVSRRSAEKVREVVAQLRSRGREDLV